MFLGNSYEELRELVDQWNKVLYTVFTGRSWQKDKQEYDKKRRDESLHADFIADTEMELKKENGE
jgi:hypothetical protein